MKNKKYGCPSCGEIFSSFGSCREHLQVCSPELLLETKGLQQRCTIGHRMCIVGETGVSLSTFEQETVEAKQKRTFEGDEEERPNKKLKAEDVAAFPQEGGVDVQEQVNAAVAHEQDVGAVVEKEVENAEKPAAALLPVGVWQSHQFPSLTSLKGRVLVLWDLDLGSWRSHGVMHKWRMNVQQIVKQRCRGIRANDACVFVGGINANVRNKNYWHRVLDEHSRTDSFWWQSWAFQLNVVPCTDQAVDERLREIGQAAISSSNPPKAVVLITLDLDFLPILQVAKTHKVKSIVLYRSRPTRDLTKSSHFRKMKEACDKCVVVNKKTAQPLELVASSKKKR